MSTLKSRIEKLEKFIPVKNSLADLTLEELHGEMFLLCQNMHNKSMEPDSETVVTNPKCRQFYKSGVPWIMDRNHRLSIFLKFKKIILKLKIPNKERIESILNLGWRDVEINGNDIDWLVTVLIDTDLGDEKP